MKYVPQQNLPVSRVSKVSKLFDALHNNILTHAPASAKYPRTRYLFVEAI